LLTGTHHNEEQPMTKRIESSIDVDVPVAVAYGQWTQFETFPQFMKHVESVRQLDDRHLHWKVRLGGSEREFDAEIVEQLPEKRIAWRSTSGAAHAGVVTFHRLHDRKCRVMLQIDYEPEGLMEKVGALTGVTELDVEKDLERFAEFIEQRGQPTGSWRGHIPNPDERRAHGAEGT
jgi:uncharacterized membrane protein